MRWPTLGRALCLVSVGPGRGPDIRKECAPGGGPEGQGGTDTATVAAAAVWQPRSGQEAPFQHLQAKRFFASKETGASR